jgi:predicted alpha/beta hydrolase
MTNGTDIKIKCAGDYELAATIFIPLKFKGAIMIAPATGIKRQFYHSFASFLADNGYGVITFNNQGIGDSKNGDLKNSNASLLSWGQSDMSFVFATLKIEFPNVKYHLVGHSAGGQLPGLMIGATELTSIFNFACSSGSLRNMKYPFKLSALFFMNWFIPFNNLLFGYTNSQWIGMGEPLPKQVAQQWSEWCNGTGYIKTYLDRNRVTHFYDELKCDSLWVNATDDKIAKTHS